MTLGSGLVLLREGAEDWTLTHEMTHVRQARQIEELGGKWIPTYLEELWAAREAAGQGTLGQPSAAPWVDPGWWLGLIFDD